MAESGFSNEPVSDGLKLEETVIAPKIDTPNSFSLEAWNSSIPMPDLASLDTNTELSSDLTTERFDLGLDEFQIDTSKDNPEKGKWLSVGGISYHANRDAGYNEFNYGLGLEVDINENKGYSFGAYRNSINRNSVYGLYHWTPLQKGPLKLGFMGGAVTGYDIPVAPLILPMAKLEGKRVGANFFCIPPIGDVSAVCAAQLKFSLE